MTDLPHLASHFLEQCAQRNGVPAEHFAPRALELLLRAFPLTNSARRPIMTLAAGDLDCDGKAELLVGTTARRYRIMDALTGMARDWTPAWLDPFPGSDDIPVIAVRR